LVEPKKQQRLRHRFEIIYKRAGNGSAAAAPYLRYVPQHDDAARLTAAFTPARREAGIGKTALLECRRVRSAH
jgi:hypothetical protein